MNKDQAAAYIRAQSVCALAEVEAMKAQNIEDAALDHRPTTYDENDFMSVPSRYGISHNAVLVLYEKCES